MKINKVTLHPAQREIANSPHRFRVVNCGRRFGKTFLAAQEMINTAVHTREGKVLYVAPNFQQARDIAWEELKKWARPITIKANESRLELTVQSMYPRKNEDPTHADYGHYILDSQNKPIYNPSTSKIFLRGWEAVESLRGQSYHFIILDEVAKMKYFDYSYKTVVLPTLTDYRGRALFLSTPRGFNHFYDLFNTQGTDEEFTSFKFPSTANPHLPVDVLEKAKYQMSPEQYAQEYEAEFKKREGLVFQSFSRQQHTYDPHTTTAPSFSETFYGIDFGFTNPSSILVIQKDRDKNYYITEEVYKAGLTNTALIERARSIPNQPRYVYADPAEPDRIEEFRNAGYYCREVKKGKGSIIKGIERLQELFKTNRIRVSLSCTHLIAELESYAYPDRKENHNDNELPIDEDNHAIDALRYALMTHDPLSHGKGSVFGRSSTDTQTPLRSKRAWIKKNNTPQKTTLLK